jgi:hypothetical protein
MRIAYLLGEDLNAHPGLREKIFGQVQEWRAHGHECFLIMHGVGQLMGPDGDMRVIDAIQSGDRGATSKLGKLWRFRRQYRFASSMLELVRPDITYSRYMFPFPGLTGALRWAGPLVLEINSDDRLEYFTKHFSTGLYNRIFRNRLLNRADGLVFVTGELARSASFSGYNARRAVIANGIHVETFPFVEDTGNDRPQLCFIGSPGQSWHGLDKLPLLAASLPECTLHVIGPSREECLSVWQLPPPNVLCHGYLDGMSSSELLSRMDIGISTLALHRKNMNEACPLKVRQYFALGLPVIAGYSDPDITEDCGFVLSLPNTEDNISGQLPEVIRFVQRVFRNSTLRNAVRDYASIHMDASRKEMARLDFFERTWLAKR